MKATANTGAAAGKTSIGQPRARTDATHGRRTASFLGAVLHQAHRPVDWWRNDPMTARFDAERRRHGIY